MKLDLGEPLNVYVGVRLRDSLHSSLHSSLSDSISVSLCRSLADNLYRGKNETRPR